MSDSPKEPSNITYENDKPDGPARYGAADLQFDDHFAEVFAVKKADKGAGRIFETLDHGFPPFDFFRADPRAHIGEKCFAALLVIADDKALEREALAHREH